MNRKHLLSVGVGAAVVALASQANATTVTFASFGGSSPLYDVPPGETLYTDFSSGLPSGAAGDGALYGPNYGTACFEGIRGYWNARPPAGITLGQLLETVEGPLFTVRGTSADQVSYLGVARPLRETWIAAEVALRGVLVHVTLADLLKRSAERDGAGR